MSAGQVSLRGHQPHVFKGQKADVLNVLLDHRGEWVPSYWLSDLALQYGARIKELRDAGYVIQNRTTRVSGKVHGAFRLVACPGFALPDDTQGAQ